MRKTIITSAAAILLSASAFAQTAQTGYFLDNNPFKYRSNAALMPERSSIGILTNNINLGLQSSLGMSSVLFSTQDGLVTGFNTAVSSEQFLGSLKPNNWFGVDINANIFSVGIRKERHFGGFELNARMVVDANVPYDMFAFLKNGSSADAYDVSGVGANAFAMLECAFTQAFKIGDKVSVGVRLKGLLGFQQMSIAADKALIKVNGEEVSATAEASIRTSGNYISWQAEDGILDLGGFAFNPAFWGPKGFGLAGDLGVEITPIENLSITVGLQDLGAIRWKYNLLATSEGNVSFEGVEDLELNNDSGDKVSENLSGQLEQLTKLKNFKVQDEPGSGLEALPFSANIGSRYGFLDGALSVGLLANFKHTRYMNSFEMRAGATASPIKWFSISANGGIGSFGPVAGAGMNLSVLGLNIHAGVDSYMGKWGKVYNVPAPLNAFALCANFGFIFTFGERH